MQISCKRIAPQFVSYSRWAPVLFSYACLIATNASWVHAAAAELDFSRDVLPVLADNCFQCHGPDSETREADLRLDTREGAFGDLGGYAAFTPNNLESSEAIARVVASDPDLRMPPPESNLELTQGDRQILIEWVNQGAKWSEHWSFLPVEKPAIPIVEDNSWPKNEVDTFVLHRLEAEKISPAQEADRSSLLRRVTYDLTGLPPTAQEYTDFFADASGRAYETVVDRLLESDACAERLTLDWLDLSRYADSHGLHADGTRRMWPWRDWVIEAFGNNMPFDEFVKVQLAGDLFPDATQDQRLATAFLRNHPMTGEGGVIDEEFRLNYVFDRAETTATALLGLTLECARCHDHKFDPLSQRNYYQFAAFFNNIRELGMTGDDGEYGPLLYLPTTQQQKEIAELDAKIAAADADLEQIAHEAFATYNGKSTDDSSIGTNSVRSDRVFDYLPKATHRFPLDTVESFEDEKEKTRYRIDSINAMTANISPEFRVGIDKSATFIDGEFGFFELADVGLIDVADSLSATLWIHPVKNPDKGTDETSKVLLGTAGDKNEFWRGWEFFLDSSGYLAFTLTHQAPDNFVRVRTLDKIHFGKWTHVGFSYDGSGKASGVHLFVDGQHVEVVIEGDVLTRTIYPAKADKGYPRDPERVVSIGRSHRLFTGDFGVYQGGLDDLQFFDTAITDLEAAAIFASYALDPGHTDISNMITRQQLFSHRLQREHLPWKRAIARHRELLAERVAINTTVPAIMVMEELPQVQEMYVYARGEYDQPGETVEPDVPFAADTFPADLPRNRLGLAEWLFLPENPLTARVAVNRYWQMLFGQGIVGTPHDFGTQGERASHPELMDWLANHFRESDWNVRDLLRLLVLSATYRQSSDIAAWRADKKSIDSVDAFALDPQNRLRWRGSSQRLPAEMIRDSALAASGLLVKTIGGPSVKPYQPEGLWIEKSNFSHELMRYVQDEGDGLYRRSMYTFLRRTSPPPSMEAFDVPNRSRCTMTREVTNTPLQALVLLNDPQFVEASRVLAEKVISGPIVLPEDRIAEVFRCLTGRAPNSRESQSLNQLFETCLSRYRSEPSAASDLLSVGETPCNKQLDPSEVAALTLVANTVMNFDAFYMNR